MACASSSPQSMAAIVGAQAPMVSQEINPCAPPQIDMSISVDPSEAAVGETVTFTSTASNPGTTDLVDVDIDASVPSSLTFASASDGGAYSSGNVAWAVTSGLPSGRIDHRHLLGHDRGCGRV